ncbi:Uu.00g003910.m01.CDS01 [Anthostomella pinea]|uniref:Uu.00g003910.m01.CDS01 n=1 Tax=Anthostomella pinea TaxID=933095 RepID=A0AAI8VJU6_9PEZI|nr:Uu.00g003910.m01.CDS01 [Anthostomella pinea]
MEEMARPTAPSNLPGLVKAAFTKARANGDLTYYPTQAAMLTPGSLAFQLRFSPSLASKPKAPKPKEPNAKPFNPFENPSAAMLIAELPPSHNLVLNKFAIVPEHFILATKEAKPQTHVLEKDDIDAAYACIRAYHTAGQELFTFFNSGEHSGASQPHRHLQLLPVERMKDGLEDADRGGEWDVLADRIRGRKKALPFSIFTAAIDAEMSGEERHDAYLALYKRAVKATIASEEVPDKGEAKISYNFAMTSTSMALCPRTAEGASIQNRSDEEAGSVALNGTVLAGTALVKNQAEWDALRENPDMLLSVLRKIGVPPTDELQGNL